jgi:hypothetical protein
MPELAKKLTQMNFPGMKKIIQWQATASYGFVCE